MLYGVLKMCTDNDRVAQKAFDVIVNSKPEDFKRSDIFANLDYFESLRYGELRALAAGDKKVSKCLTDTREYLFKQRVREEELKVVNC